MAKKGTPDHHHHHDHHHGHHHRHHHSHHHGHHRPSSDPSSPAPPSAPPNHTFSATVMEETISDAEEIFTRWDPQASSHAKVNSLFQNGREEARRFLSAVADLQHAMRFFVADSHVSSSDLIVRAQTLMQAAMRRLQKEFHRILSARRCPLDPESASGSTSGRSSLSLNSSSLSLTSSFSLSDIEEEETRSTTESLGEMERVSALAVADLRSIAESMISSGYGKECTQIYKLVRRSIVDEGIYKLGFERLSPAQIQKLDWDALDVRIRIWLAASKVAVRNLFSGERALCDQVFPGSDSIRDSCFAEIFTEPAVQLLGFPEQVSSKKITRFTPEKMFQILDMYENVSELWPEIQSVFSEQSMAAVPSQAASSLHKMGEAVRSMLTEFESLIQKDHSKAAVPGGGLHPLSRYVMNYVALLADYSTALEDIFADYPLHLPTPLPEFDDPTSTSAPSSPSSGEGENPLISPASVRIGWIILVLLCKLDGKAKLYREAALAYLFLANNLHYVVEKVCGCRLLDLLGDDWVARHEAKAKGYAARYGRLAWSHVLAAIPHDGAVVAEMDAEAAREGMRRFNEAFEEACRGQAGWAVPDGRTREEIRLFFTRKVVAGYRPFYERCRLLLRGERESPAVVRFAPEDLTKHVFDGGSGAGSSVSSSVSSLSGSSGEPRRH